MILIMILAVFLMPAVKAEIAVESFILDQETVFPGNEVSVDITVKNAGDETIEDIIVTLDLSQVPFAPIESSNEKVIGELEDHERREVHFKVRSLPDAEPSVYKIPVVITYNGTTKTSLISIEVSADATLDVILDHSEVVKVNDQGKVSIKFINNGLTEVKFLKITLLESPFYKIISPDIAYIGSVDVDDFQTEEFTIIPSAENPVLVLQLEYRDSHNQEFSKTRLMKLNVYSEEEAKELGLVKPQSIFSSVGIAVIAGIVGYIVYRRIKKRRKNAI